MPKVAKILLGPPHPELECRIIDQSPGGVGMELPRLVDLPKKFEILYAGSRKSCHLVWQNGFRLGLSFADVVQTSSGFSRSRSSGSSGSYLSRTKR